MSSLPNYYEILSLNSLDDLTNEQIRAAYKKATLLTHPDRNPGASEFESRRAHENFQKVADAYYILSDPTRKKEYDRLLRNQQESNSNQHQESFRDDLNDPLRFAKSFFFDTQDSNAHHGQRGRKPDPHATFAEVFEDLLRPEIENLHEKTWLWKYLGAVSGGTLGFIVGNFPGMTIGAIAGNRLGAIRDAKGKSVCEVFAQLEPMQKMKILSALASKILGFVNPTK